MNSAEIGLASALIAAGVAAAAGLAGRRQLAGIGTVLCGLGGVTSGAAAIGGGDFAVDLPDVLPLTGVRLAIDPLGGLFVAVTGGVAVLVGIYGLGYSRHGRVTQAMVPLFVAAMLLVPAADGMGTLLLCWELMALTSLVLVLAEHRERAEVAVAARWYAVMTHLGLVAILIGLMTLSAHSGDSFAAARNAHLPDHVAGLVFVTTLIGFASKAGIVPLHAWLPRAHPEAPSHVSALMSAAMVNLGVYGIVRVGLDLLGGGPRWWWLITLALGAVSALYGILQAAMSTDLKRLLGYSSTENMGLVLIGVGAAGMFASVGHRDLAGLALAAAMLHVINHAAFKTLLFLAAGSVLHSTGSRDLDQLGGLRSRMPVTTAAFGIGALTASALPPGAAFISEWLLLQGLIHGLGAGGTLSAIVMPVAVATVALTAGLAVATFVKAFGVGFLARPRSAQAEGAHESPKTMLTAMGIAAASCVGLAVLPTLLVPRLGSVTSVVSNDPATRGAVTLRLADVAGSLSPLVLVAALIAGFAVVWGTLRAVSMRRQRRDARLWDCGAGPLSARMEYTATSFAEPLQRVFDDVLRPENDVDVTHHEESAYLVRAIEYRRRVPDRIERRLYEPVLSAVRGWGHFGRRLATGSVHRYLGYGFYAVTGLLILLAVTR